MFKYYEVTPEGSVKNLRTGRILKTDVGPSGYHRVTMSEDSVVTRFFLHRLVAMKYVQNPENKPMVNHKDGNKDNNHFENLEWVTCKENTIHAFDTNLRKSGQDSYQATISNDQVKLVCELLSQGLMRKEIMERTGVNKYQFDSIRSRKSWKRISCNYQWQTFND